MSFNELIEQTKVALQEDPNATEVSLETGSELLEGTEVEVRVGERRIRADEPEKLGGTDTAPNPVEYALAALGSCQAITYRVWADRLGLSLDRVRVHVAGDLDLKGFFGLDPSTRPGFGGVDVRVELDGPEEEESYKRLFQVVNRHCPVLDLFENPVPVELRFGAEEGGTSDG